MRNFFLPSMDDVSVSRLIFSLLIPCIGSMSLLIHALLQNTLAPGFVILAVIAILVQCVCLFCLLIILYRRLR